MLKNALTPSAGAIPRAAIFLVAVLAIGIVVALAQREAAVGETGTDTRAQDVDEALATIILGQSLPRPGLSSFVLTRSELTADPPSVGGVSAMPRLVRQAFAVNKVNVALLTVFRGTFNPTTGTAGTVLNLNGRDVGVSSTQIPDGTLAIGYVWSAHGLVYNFHVNLNYGISRDIADQLAASIP
jgi:hypothetical protein